jgi:hypothetical protein
MKKKLSICLLIMMVILSCAIMFQFQTVAAESWLTGWRYRKSHVINPASGAGANYQVRIKARWGEFTQEDLVPSSEIVSTLPIPSGTSIISAQAAVYWDGTHLHVWYGATTGGDINDSIYYTKASSPFTNWNTPIKVIDRDDGIRDPTIFIEGDNIYLFCQCFDGEIYRPIRLYKNSKTADFTNPSNYVYIGVVIDVGAGTYDENMAASPSVVKVGGTYYLMYEAFSSDWKGSIGRAKSTNIESLPWIKDGQLRDTKGNVIYNPSENYADIVPDTFADEDTLFIHYWDGLNWRVRYINGDFANNSVTLSDVDITLHDSYSDHNNIAHVGIINGVYYFLMQSWNDAIYLRLYASVGSVGDTIALHSHSRTDFGDVRFTRSDGVTLLDYWMESKVDSDYAVFWVKVADNLSTNPAMIYIYYGKSDVTTTSNGNNTFLSFDDFSGNSLDSNKWTSVIRGNGGSVTVANGEVTLNPNDNTISSASIQSVATFTNNILIRIKRKYTAGTEDYLDTSLGAGAVVDEMGNPYWWWHTTLQSGYVWIYHSAYGGYAGLRRMPASGAHVELSITSKDLFDTSYKIHDLVYTSNGVLKWIVDGGQVFNAADTSFLTNNKKILISQGEYENGQGANAVIDYVFVRKNVDPEPAHGSWGSEETSDSVIIDKAFVSDERADLSSIQTIGFHAKWNNGSDVVGGSIYVNGTNYVTNSTGWINVKAAARIEASDNFTIIALPDTQFYSASHPEIFDSQTQWVVNNAQSMNIVFVTHEGDIVDDYSSLSQWNNANNSMSKLDAGNVSYGVLPGNHDGSPLYLSNFNKFFNYSRFNGKSWYGGAYQNENANNFELFHGGQDDYLIFHFQYDPSDQVLTWANSTLQNYPNRQVIVTTHSYLNLNGSRTDIGNRIWQNFVAPHADQIFLVLCGHNHGETQRTDIINGHTVYQIMADYQDRTNGGNGWLRILEFHPVEDKIYVRTYSPYLNNYETDTDSQFTLDYNMTWVPSSIVEKVTWIVTGVNCSGVTTYSQIVQNPSIIWDRIKIGDGGISKGSVMLGEKVTVWFKALYEYDNDIFDGANGVLYLNGFPMLWSTTNNQWQYDYTATTIGTKMFTISEVSDTSYDLTVINDNIGAQTLDVWSLPFSVISNSTVSEIAFNSTIRVLSFTVSGPSGTVGYTNVTIARALIANISELKVNLDGNQINYTATSTDYSWLIHFTYGHSTHKIVILLSSLHANSSYTVSLEPTIFGGIIIAMIAAILLIYKKAHKKTLTFSLKML